MNEINTYFWLILTVAFVASVFGSLIVRRKRRPFALRRIRGYQAMPLMIEEAIESNRRAHISIGSAAIGQPSTLIAVAALRLVYQLAERQGFAPNLPLVTLTDPITLAAAQDALRRAYLAHDNLEDYHSHSTVWFPQGDRSMAFAAGVANLSQFEDVSSNIMLGAFGPELALIGEASTRRETFFMGHSTQLEGQAVAFAQADMALIGEELFVGEAYLDPENTGAMTRLFTLDVLRWAIIVAIIVIALIE